MTVAREGLWKEPFNRHPPAANQNAHEVTREVTAWAS